VEKYSGVEQVTDDNILIYIM